MTPEKAFETEFFNMLLDTALMSVKESFEKLLQHAGTWCFMHKSGDLPKRRPYKALFRSSVGFGRLFECRYRRSFPM
jgi:hypothetical protein